MPDNHDAGSMIKYPGNGLNPMDRRTPENSGRVEPCSKNSEELQGEQLPPQQSCYGMTLSCAVYRSLEQIRR